MSTVTPVWTDNVTVLAAQVLAPNNIVRATLDLRTKAGAMVTAFVGRGGTGALSTGVRLEVRRTLNNDALKFPGAPVIARLSQIAAAIVKQINYGAGYAAGSTALVLDGTGTPAADEDYFQWGTASDPSGLSNGDSLGTTWECLRAKSFATATITVEATKRAVSDNYYLTNKCDQWTFWVPGGATYEVVYDYYDSGSPQNVAVGAYGQTYDSDSIT